MISPSTRHGKFLSFLVSPSHSGEVGPVIRTAATSTNKLRKQNSENKTRARSSPELLSVDWLGCPGPRYPGRRVTTSPTLQDEVPAHQGHGLRLGFGDEVGRLVDTQSHTGRLPGSGNVLSLALVLALV